MQALAAASPTERCSVMMPEGPQVVILPHVQASGV